VKYDIIIVESGAAGGILALRLTENPDKSVLLLEVGPDFPEFEYIPEEIKFAYGNDRNAGVRAFGNNTKFGWGYTAQTTRQGDTMLVSRGKVIGGPSAVNAQLFLRGVPEDYDSRAQTGDDKWSFAELIEA